MPLIAPDRNRSSDADRMYYLEWFEEHGAYINTKSSAKTWFASFENVTGKSVVSKAEFEMIRDMRDAVHSHPTAGALLKGGVAETSHFAEINGVPCKCRPDYNGHALVDVKSCVDASNHAFARSVANYKYHLQQAVYQQIVNETEGVNKDFVFIACEKSSPYPVAVYQLNFDAVSNGVYLMDKALELYRSCSYSGSWPSYDDDDELSIPIYDREPDLHSLAALEA